MTTWLPYREPLRATLLRTVTIALVGGAALAAYWGGLDRWPAAALGVLWFSLGGHFVELAFLNGLRPRLPAVRAVQVGARVGMWYVGGAVLTIGMGLTAARLAPRPSGVPPWWVGGFAFIAAELLVHAAMSWRRRPNFYDGRG